jgi:hypothetical protein
MPQFIAEMQADKAARDAIIDRLRPLCHPAAKSAMAIAVGSD